MEEPNDGADKQDGDLNDVAADDQNTTDSFIKLKKTPTDGDVTLEGLLRRLISQIIFPDSDSSYASTPPLRRIKASLSENVPLLREALTSTSRNVLLWMRRGSPVRALLVFSVGTIILMTLTGLLLFILFFLAATINAIVISFLVSLAAAGGFLALFFASVATIYIGALAISFFFISSATISAIVAVLIATGWIGFFLALFLAAKKGMNIAKASLHMTGSAISAYSFTRHSGNHHGPD